MVAPPEARAALQPEPAPPSGVGVRALRQALVAALGEERGDAMFQWMTIQMPEWGREGWRRTEVLSKSALDAEK